MNDFNTTSDENLLTLSMKDLVSLYNSYNPLTLAKAKTFSTKTKAVNAINKLVDSLPQEETEDTSEASEEVESVDSKDEEQMTVGARVQALLLHSDPSYSYREILEIILEEYKGANTTANCLRWYANELKGLGVSLPARPRSNWKD